MGKTEEKRCATNQKETEEQLPKRDHKKALLTDIKSKIESISRCPDEAVCHENGSEEVHAFGV